MALRCSYAGAGLCLSWEFGRKVRGMIEPSCLNPFLSWAEKLQTTAVAMGPDWDPADVKVFGSPFLRFPLRVYTACHRFPPLGLSHPETQPERTCVLYSPGPCHHLAFCVRSTDTASARGAGGGAALPFLHGGGVRVLDSVYWAPPVNSRHLLGALSASLCWEVRK